MLVHPRNADNLVSIAAAMRSFGLTDWVLVSPRVHLDGMHAVLRQHRAHTEFTDAVLQVRRVETLAAAIADCAWVVGTTMRTLEGRSRLTPRELAEATATGRDAPWALVFGAESNGLQREHLAQCHTVSFIPSSHEQPSLNLSQAVVVYAHELATAQAREESADDATLGDLRSSIVAGAASALDAEALMACLMRGNVTAAEARRWSATFRALTPLRGARPDRPKAPHGDEGP